MHNGKATTRKCPNCGQRTIVDDTLSCQWCHWPLMAKTLKSIRPTKGTKWFVPPRWIIIYTAVVLVFYMLLLFGLNNWELSALLKILGEQWYILFLVLFLIFSCLFLFHLLVTRIQPIFILAALFLLAFFLLYASNKESLFQQSISEWIDKSWDISLFSASITVLSLTLAFGIIVFGGRGK